MYLSQSSSLYRVNVNCLRVFMLCNPAHQLLYELPWKHRLEFFFLSLYLPFFIFPSSSSLFHTFHFWTYLHSITVSYKGCIQSNHQLALSRLMHSIHCGSAVFPYQALERRPTQETLIGCAGLHYKKFKGIEHSSCIKSSIPDLLHVSVSQIFLECFLWNNLLLIPLCCLRSQYAEWRAGPVLSGVTTCTSAGRLREAKVRCKAIHSSSSSRLRSVSTPTFHLRNGRGGYRRVNAKWQCYIIRTSTVCNSWPRKELLFIMLLEEK
jgi:hypothetical protein